MPTPKKGARIVIWKGEEHLFYTDHTTGKTHRLNCRANGWTSEKKKRKALKKYREKEMLAEAERATRGGMLAYDTPLLKALDDFLERTKERAEARGKNPNAPDGIARSTADSIEFTLTLFKKWLNRKHKGKLTTGSLDPALLESFLNFLATDKTRRGNLKGITRSQATLNKHRQNIRTCLNFIDRQRPPRFPDFEIFRRVLRSRSADRKRPIAIAPENLTTFLLRAWMREDPDRKIKVQRTRKGMAGEYVREVGPRTATPISRLFLLLALTGCRLNEALALRWEHVDLLSGHITFYRVQKTARTRILPLIRAPEGNVSPGLLELLKLWRDEDKEREYVLPVNGSGDPAFRKSSWQAVYEGAKISRIGPQMLRQNFTSYAASLGVPPAVCAQWQGHSAEVAESYYRAQVLSRRQGKSIEEAMGLKLILQKMAWALQGVDSWESVRYR